MKLLYGFLVISSLNLGMSQMEMGKAQKIKIERSDAEACADCLCTPALYGKSFLFAWYAFFSGYCAVENMQQPQSSMGLTIAYGTKAALDVAIVGAIGHNQFEKSKKIKKVK
ncbi:hypothetical protein BH09DEP1_BH09DEP1_0380 [soil metagenome]